MRPPPLSVYNPTQGIAHRPSNPATANLLLVGCGSLSQNLTPELCRLLKAQMSHLSTHWYCVQSKPHREFLAVRLLQSLGFKPVLLTVTSDRTSRNKTKSVTTSMFGSYFFVPFDVQHDNWRQITSTYGVRRILSSTPETPTPIPDGVVEDLIKCSEQPEPDAVILPINPGCTARVIAGPLASTNTIGVCDLVHGDRVRLLIQAMQGTIRVTFHVSDLELLE